MSKVIPRRLKWADAVRESDLDTRAKLLCLILATYMNAQLEAFPTQETLSRGCSFSISGVERATKRAEAHGFLEVERPKGPYALRYHGTFPEPVTSDGLAAHPANGNDPVTGDGYQPTQPVTSDGSNPSLVTDEPNKEPKNPRQRKAARAGEADGAEELRRELDKRAAHIASASAHLHAVRAAAIAATLAELEVAA